MNSLANLTKGKNGENEKGTFVLTDTRIQLLDSPRPTPKKVGPQSEEIPESVTHFFP